MLAAALADKARLRPWHWAVLRTYRRVLKAVSGVIDCIGLRISVPFFSEMEGSTVESSKRIFVHW